MFRASSGAPNCICTLWCIYQRLQIQFGAPDDERYAARNMLSLQKLWNNKFYYKDASCWYFNLVIYDARIHEYQIRDLVFVFLK